MGRHVKKKRYMKFKSLDQLQNLVNVLNEASEALKDSTRTIQKSAIPEVLGGLIGAGFGAAGSFGALYGLGIVGLSGPGIMTGLAAAGGIIGAGAAGGIIVLAAPVAVLAAGGVAAAAHSKQKRMRYEKRRLYQEALRKQNAILKALKEESDENRERVEYLTSLNILLQQAIKDLQHDMGITEKRVAIWEDTNTPNQKMK